MFTGGWYLHWWLVIWCLLFSVSLLWQMLSSRSLQTRETRNMNWSTKNLMIAVTGLHSLQMIQDLSSDLHQNILTVRIRLSSWRQTWPRQKRSNPCSPLLDQLRYHHPRHRATLPQQYVWILRCKDQVGTRPTWWWTPPPSPSPRPRPAPAAQSTRASSSAATLSTERMTATSTMWTDDDILVETNFTWIRLLNF